MWDDREFQPLPRAALQIRLMGGLLAVVFVVALAAAIDLVVRRSTEFDPPVAVGVIPAMIGIVLLVVVEFGLWLGWRVTGWRLDERLFAMRSGVYTREWTGVPRDRVQSVLVATNPLQRWRGLATVTVRTAGAHTPAVVLSDVEEAAAEHVRRELAPTSLERPQ
ncbi:MAG: PH domain-containing protein [Actinomycetota bacterium]